MGAAQRAAGQVEMWMASREVLVARGAPAAVARRRHPPPRRRGSGGAAASRGRLAVSRPAKQLDRLDCPRPRLPALLSHPPPPPRRGLASIDEGGGAGGRVATILEILRG